MSLDTSLLIAAGSLSNVNRKLAVVSQNVSNANTPDYTREVSTQQSVSAAGIGMGVRSGIVGREIDLHLQADLFSQNGAVAAAMTRQAALARLDTTQGAPGSGTDLASRLGALQDAFSSLENDPASAVQQRRVVNAADNLAKQVNTLADAYSTARQSAQDGLVDDVNTMNSTLTRIGKLSLSIIEARVTGQSTADLENQRDTVLSQLSRLVDVRALQQPDGDLLLLSGGGVTLPTRGGSPFALPPASLGPGATYATGSVPRITLNGSDVTTRLTGGRIGANLGLRDTTMPVYQAELDEFTQSLSSRFDQQGLTLFVDANGQVPTKVGVPVQASYVGYANSVQVNTAVTADPSLVRDGTHTVAASPGGASSFTPNPAGGPAGFSGMIGRVLSFTFGSRVQANVSQPPPSTTGLGKDGDLSAPYSPPGDLASFASSLIATQSQDSAKATATADDSTAVQAALQGKVTARSGVSIDTEMATMVQLQGSYAASAKLISAVQTMWSQTLQMVQ